MKLIQLLLPAAMLLLSSNAFAGEYNAAPVNIDLVNQTAYGNLYEARFSPFPDERIGCAVASGDERGLFAYCEATTQGVSTDCFTYDQKMIQTIASINTFSFVYFTWEQQNRKGFDDNICTNVTVATRSVHIPQGYGADKLRYAEIEPYHCTDRQSPEGYANAFTLPAAPEGQVLFVRSIAFKKSTGGWFPLWRINIFGNGFWLWGWTNPDIPTPTLFVGFQNIDVRIPQPPESALLDADGTLSCDNVPLLSIFYEFVPEEI